MIKTFTREDVDDEKEGNGRGRSSAFGRAGKREDDRLGDEDLLFVCSQNRRRSLTAETMFDGVNGHHVRSAGTEKNARIKVTAGLISWSDVIFCFEKKYLRRMQERYGQELCGKKVITMNVPNEYEYMDEELQEILRGFAEEFLCQADA